MPKKDGNHIINGFRSKFEESLAKQLEDAKVPFLYEPYPISYKLPANNQECEDCGSKNVSSRRRYTPDFVSEDGSIVVEAKGKFTDDTRKKMQAVVESNPHLDIRLLFMRDNWMRRTHCNRYSDWCRKKGIKWAVGEFPEEWLKEFKEARSK